jgi:hypothetical protein
MILLDSLFNLMYINNIIMTFKKREKVEKNLIFIFYYILIHIEIFKSINKHKLKFLC